MAVAVIEREQINSSNALRRSDEAHNARIKTKYAMLINPDVKLDELLERNQPQAAAAEETVAVQSSVTVPVREVMVNKPYLVENARADSVLFRADNPLNRRNTEVAQENVQQPEEEENEDSLPTPTTIQYRSVAVQNTVEEGKISNSGAEKRAKLSKKERIIIAVVVSVIVALFALIIVNSAIISNLNSDIGSLQSSLTDVTRAYSGISGQVRDFESTIFDRVDEFAQFNNMIKIS